MGTACRPVVMEPGLRRSLRLASELRLRPLLRYLPSVILRRTTISRTLSHVLVDGYIKITSYSSHGADLDNDAADIPVGELAWLQQIHSSNVDSAHSSAAYV